MDSPAYIIRTPRNVKNRRKKEGEEGVVHILVYVVVMDKLQDEFLCDDSRSVVDLYVQVVCRKQPRCSRRHDHQEPEVCVVQDSEDQV